MEDEQGTTQAREFGRIRAHSPPISCLAPRTQPDGDGPKDHVHGRARRI
jgi:hypothetical protein